MDSVTTVSFPPSNINAETTVDITLSDDAVHENQEVFVISLTVSELSNSRDVMASSALFGGVAAVLITDNDSRCPHTVSPIPAFVVKKFNNTIPIVSVHIIWYADFDPLSL